MKGIDKAYENRYKQNEHSPLSGMELYYGSIVDAIKNEPRTLICIGIIAKEMNRVRFEQIQKAMPTDEEIQKHIIEMTRNDHGDPAMDEQAFYEGAKWMRSRFMNNEPSEQWSDNNIDNDNVELLFSYVNSRISDANVLEELIIKLIEEYVDSTDCILFDKIKDWYNNKIW